MNYSGLKILVAGAHPDDADTFAGCAAIKWAARGACVRFLSVCNGDKGWHLVPNDGVAQRRLGEAAAAAKLRGLDGYDVWEIPDCEIEPTLELRKRMTRYVRAFAPDVIITHRTCDYHADHRACSQLVQDMTYLLGLPNWCPECPPPGVRPAVFFMTDDFDTPRALRPDAVVAADDVLDIHLDALACHESQFFEFLPVDMGLAPSEVPSRSDTAAARRYMLEKHDCAKRTDAVRFAQRVSEWYPDIAPHYIEAFEMSKYGRQMSEEELRELFRM